MQQPLFRPSATARVEPTAADAAYGESLAPQLPLRNPEPTNTKTATRAKAATTHETYRELLRQGMTSGEAANLTAFSLGLYPTEESWTVEEINRLLFLRDLDRRGSFPA
jgi:uncharacterized protein YoaH (UPF0181 family)